MIKHDTIKLHTIEGRASYHDLREDLVRIALDSGLADGVMIITTPKDNIIVQVQNILLSGLH